MNRDDWGFSAVAVAAALGAAIALTFGNPRAEHVLVVALLMLAGLTLVMGLMLWRNYKRSDAIPQDEQQSKESVDGGTVATAVYALVAQGRASDRQKKFEDREKGFREWVTIAAVAITALFVIGQYHEMRLVLQPIQRQADANTVTAAATRDAVTLTKGQMRAYMSIAPNNVFHADSTGNPVEAYVMVKNTGQTPAREIHTQMGIAIADIGQSVSEKPTVAPTLTTLGKDQELFLHQISKIQLTTAQATALRAQRLRIVVFGSITFRDAFGDRWTDEYCFQFTGNGIEQAGNKYMYPGLTAQACAA